MTRFLAGTLILCGTLAAQEMRNHAFHLDNGALVLYQSYSEIALRDDQKAFGTATAQDNMVRRTLVDASKDPWLAFELHIDRKPGPGPIRFLLSMEPVASWNFFGQKPAIREIDNGDRILLPVLEDPRTGRKVFDTFQVGIGVPMQIMPLPRSVPQLPRPGSEVRLQDPQFMKGMNVLGHGKGIINGIDVGISVPNAGLFVFSSRPAPGFRMEAVAEGRDLRFVSGSDSYHVQCSGPVIATAGSWYLWLKHEPTRADASVPTLELLP